MLRYSYSWIAREVSALSRYCGALVQWRRRPDDTGLLLDLADAPSKGQVETSQELQSHARSNGPLYVLINGNTNYDLDVEATLREIRAGLTRSDRVVVIAYNPYLKWLYQLANRLGLRSSVPPTTFITRNDFASLCKLSGYELVRSRPTCYCPLSLGPVSRWLNRGLALFPIIRSLSLAEVVVLRPIIPSEQRPSLTVIVPARNEKGNMEPLLERMPQLAGCQLELIFVEGHSNDGTWEEIQRLLPAYNQRFPTRALQQSGKGKSDAVRLGFAAATSDLVTILDADLTMPPEKLERFYEAYCAGLGDFINGNRLTYPMEGEAMRFLNRIGNMFFAKALSAVLEAPLGDSLCGTKLLSRQDYKRMCDWREDFGDFDPFGDFELLFPASQLGLGIVDLPIRYLDRTYGSTNISRFYHGAMLLKMTLIGLLKIRLSPPPSNFD